jgi:hypothetical protein
VKFWHHSLPVFDSSMKHGPMTYPSLQSNSEGDTNLAIGWLTKGRDCWLLVPGRAWCHRDIISCG